jgi:hypothetical protein
MKNNYTISVAVQKCANGAFFQCRRCNKVAPRHSGQTRWKRGSKSITAISLTSNVRNRAPRADGKAVRDDIPVAKRRVNLANGYASHPSGIQNEMVAGISATNYTILS